VKTKTRAVGMSTLLAQHPSLLNPSDPATAVAAETPPEPPGFPKLNRAAKRRAQKKLGLLPK